MYSFEEIKVFDPELSEAIEKEIGRQNDHIELIASENYVSPAVLQLAGTVLTNKYAEGYPGKRYYNGCENVDLIETLAIERLKVLFECGHKIGEKFLDEHGNEWTCKKANAHANVQAHSGSQANTAAYAAVLQPGDKILGMTLAAGGHLTHGYKVNFSGKNYQGIGYGVDRVTEKLDFTAIEQLAIHHQPQIIVAGASAYSRIIDWSAFRKIADMTGAYLMVDIAHIAGLIVAGKHPNPVCHADIITTTTHKTLRGPRGGAMLCVAKLAKKIDSAIFPGNQGGPLEHIIAGKAQAFYEATTEAFKTYQQRVINNAQAFAQVFIAKGFAVVSGGTDNHLFTVKVCNEQKRNFNGKIAVQILEQINIIANKNAIPFDKLAPVITSGVRFGTAAMTTRGFSEAEFIKIANIIVTAWNLKFKIEKNVDPKTKLIKEVIFISDQAQIKQLKAAVAEILLKFPIYKTLVN